MLTYIINVCNVFVIYVQYLMLLCRVVLRLLLCKIIGNVIYCGWAYDTRTTGAWFYASPRWVRSSLYIMSVV